MEEGEEEGEGGEKAGEGKGEGAGAGVVWFVKEGVVWFVKGVVEGAGAEIGGVMVLREVEVDG